MNAAYTIKPLVVAWGPQREMSRFTYLTNFGQKIDIPYIAFLVEGNGRRILVDSGCSAEDYLRWIKPASGEPLQAGGEVFKDVVDDKPLEKALQAQGLDLADIDTVFQTHLHWDHCMNTLKFQGATVLLQKTELEDQPVHPMYRFTHAPDEIYERMREMKLEIIDGDKAIDDGLDALYTPGHTAGGQSLSVQTAQGRYVIAGLCTIRANYYVDAETQRRLGWEVVPPGSHVSAPESYESVLRVRKLAGENVLPLHEPALAGVEQIG